MGSPFSPSQFQFWTGLLRQPASIATLISLGFHGVLFGAAPGFSSLNMAALGGTDEQQQRTVPLIELSPEEQSRLPDFSSSAYSLFPGAPGSGSFDLLPVPGGQTAIPSDPFDPSGRSSPVFPPNPFAIGSAPYTPPSLGSRPTIVFPSRRSNLPPVRQPPASRAADPAKPEPAQGRRPGAASTPSSGASTPSTAARPSAPAAPGAASTPGAAALEPEPRPGSPTSEPAAGAGPGSALQAQLAALIYSDEGTTAEAAAANRQDWVAALQAETDNPDLAVVEDPVELPVTYQGRVCLSPEPSDGLIGVWIKPDGSLGSEPVLLQSTGYPLLNQQAADAIAELAFPEADADTLYQIAVKVSYDGEGCLKREQILEQRPNE
jgi:hypothetical protein